MIKRALQQYIASATNFFIGTIISFAALNSGCQQQTKGSTNNFELYKKKYSNAIAHYSAPKDSLKLKALYFILRNIDDQYYYSAYWIDTYNNALAKTNRYTVDDLITKRDSIQQLYHIDLTKNRDKNVVTNSYLDQAFNSIQTKWSKDISFSDFCEYILPYKISNEKPESFRDFTPAESYLLKDSLSQISDIFSATNYINNHLSWYKGTLNYDYPIDAGYKISRLIATGSCYSTTRMALFQMRSIGLPVVIDFAPSWGNRSEGHYWNALMYHNLPYPFDPTGPNIGFYKIEFKGVNRMPYKISKVFRETFSIQNNSLAAIKESSDLVPKVFDNKRIKDVTSEYVPVSDITLCYHKNINQKFAYLYTFNDQGWIPSFWGTINNQKIAYKDMARDIVYMPALYLNESQFVPLGNPFILYSNGFTKELKPETKIKQTLTLIRKYPDDETNKIMPGDVYELFYWDGNWKSLGIIKAIGDKINFDSAPLNALFLLRDLTKGNQERIFTYENSKQVWW
jgi:hypothetical protein